MSAPLLPTGEGRRGGRPLPSGTLVAFVLLICAVVSSMTILHPAYADFLAGDRGETSAPNACMRAAIERAGGLGAFVRGPRDGSCDGSDDHTGEGILISYAVLAVATALHYWFRSARRARKRGVRALDAERFPALHAEIERLTAGVGQARGVTVLVDFLDSGVNGVTFGRAGRRHIVLSRGLVALYEGDAAQREAFRAVVLHELAHLRNRDVDITMITLSLLRCFFVLILGPRVFGDLFGVLFVPGGAVFFGARILDALALWWVIRAARGIVLRTREFLADARVVEWQRGSPRPLLGAFGLAAETAPRSRRPSRTHPSFAERKECLADRSRLMYQGFGFAFVVGFCLPLAWDPVSSITAQWRVGGGVKGWWPAELITALVVLVLFLTVARAALHDLGGSGRRPPRARFRTGLAVGICAGYAVAPSVVVDHTMMPGLRPDVQASGWLVVALIGLGFTWWCELLARSWAVPLAHAGTEFRGVALLGLAAAAAAVLAGSTVFELQWQIEMGQFMSEDLAALPGPVHAALWTLGVAAYQLSDPVWFTVAAALLLGIPLAGRLRARGLARPGPPHGSGRPA
ncbi:M48 family metallopeptidase [Streptomyces sp. NPDC058290]|uniref:M48 family metallopeptidase n=1 Tax=Streptomyces sp. NPDC058290 TaxID=3346426 RepID=UPI0036E004A1